MDYRVPLYIQLKEMILQRIADGEYLPGERIPSEREMATTYKINRMTVKNAINSLVKEGVLCKVKNTGVYVKKKQSSRMYYFKNSKTDGNASLGALLQVGGHNVVSEVCEKGYVEHHNLINYKLNLEDDEKAYALHRLRKVNDEVIAFEMCYVPAKYFPDIDEHNFAKASLYGYMETVEHLPVTFEQRMIIEKARRPFKKVMGLNDNDYVYALEYVGSDSDGNVVEFTRSYIRTDFAIYTFDIGTKE